MARIDLGKPDIPKIRQFPLDVEFTWCNGDGPLKPTVKIRQAGEASGCGYELHLFKADPHLIKVAVPDELAAKLCHGLHFIDVLEDNCFVCVSKPLFLDYTCAEPVCDITVVTDCGSEVKCNV